VRSLSIEQLILLALFVLVPLVNLLARWVRRRTEPGERPPEEAKQEPEPVPFRLPPRILVPTPVEPRRVEPPRPAAPTPPPGLRRRGPMLQLSGPADVRRAVMLMAVLGPCRGLESPGAEGERLDR